MTRLRWPAWCLAVALASSGAVRAGIPAHPRELRFENGTFRVPEPAPRTVDLTSGVRAFLERDPLLPLIEVSLVFATGTHDDPPGKSGLSILTADLLARGGSRALAPAELDAAFEGVGARLRSFVGQRRAVVRLSVPSWAAPGALDTLFDLLAEPRFSAERLDITRRTALDEIARRNENPLDVLEREWTWLLFGEGHPSGRAASPESLGSITRDELVAFYGCRWRPADAVVAISGDVSSRIERQIDDRMTAWIERRVANRACPAVPPTDAATTPASAGVHVAFHEAPQAKILIGHALSELPDWTERERFALLFATEILGGGGAISRLNGRLRAAEGLVYRASARLEVDTPDQNELRLFMETRPDRAWRAVEIALEELERFRAELVHPRELEVVRETLIGVLRSEFDTAEEIVGYLAENALLDRPLDYWQRYLDAVRTIDREEVGAAARKYFDPGRLTVLVVGPEAELVGRSTEGEPVTPSGQPVKIRPSRDPLTLEPLPTAPPGPAEGS